MPKNVSQSKDAKNGPGMQIFKSPASTGRKVEMASANAAHNQTHLRSMITYIVTKFGTNWFIFVDAGE